MRHSCDAGRLYEVDGSSLSQENTLQEPGADKFDFTLAPPKTTLLMIDELEEKNLAYD